MRIHCRYGATADHSVCSFGCAKRSELTWSEETGKLLTLSRRLAPGAMIFVRLLQPTDGERAFPVAYETEALPDASEKTEQFRITRVVPHRLPVEGA